MMFDLRKLRDRQMPDAQGRVLPLEATHGQVHWSIEGDENLRLIGRAEQMDAVRGMSMTSSCMECCPDSWYSFWITPGSAIGFPGDTTQFNSIQQNQTCYGEVLDPFTVPSPTWSSTNPSVAGCSSTGLATAQLPGFTHIQSRWTVRFWDSDFDGLCHRYLEQALVDALCDVLNAPDHVKVILDQAGYPQACPSTGIYVRQIQVQVVDSNNNNVTSGFSVKESYSNLSTNTCGNGNSVPSSCAPADSGGKFLDTMAVSGNLCNSGISQSSGCGFTQTSTWSVCSGTVQNNIWTLTRETRSNTVKVNGQSSVYPAGTYLYP